jgi:16S rRNA processing protein RimM
VSAREQRDQNLVPLGYISGVYGIKGWVKVHSYTSPREAILAYQPWLLGEQNEKVSIREGRKQAKTIVVSLPGVDDPEAARQRVGQEIAIYRSQLPDADEASWYWTDLVGLEVETADGADLGKVTRMMETGAHDVMLVSGDRERLIPFVPEVYVISVDLEKGRLVVNWEPDFLE